MWEYYSGNYHFSEVHFTYISHTYTSQKTWIVIITAESTSCLAIYNAINCMLNKHFALVTIFVSKNGVVVFHFATNDTILQFLQNSAFIQTLLRPYLQLTLQIMLQYSLIRKDSYFIVMQMIQNVFRSLWKSTFPAVRSDLTILHDHITLWHRIDTINVFCKRPMHTCNK